MQQSYIQNLFADRIGGSNYGKNDTLYKFEKIKRAKLAAIEKNPGLPLIDLGVGEPDAPAELPIIDVLYQEALNPLNRGYADNGCQEFKDAIASFMLDTFGVSLDPVSQIIHSIGSKSALSLLSACFINPGDIVLMTTPGYPIFGTHARYYGGDVYNLSLIESNAYLPDLHSIPPHILKKAKVLVLNYPNNPTGAGATPEFYTNTVAWAKANNIIIIQDAAYASLTFEGAKPLSILQIPGAIDVAVELHSLSKSFNMTGWRLGWVCGNPLIVKAYADVKDNSDSGQFIPIQKAAAKALSQPSIIRKTAQKYGRRMDLLLGVLNKFGFKATKPNAGFFLYCKSPKSATKDAISTHFNTAEDFSHWLIHNTLISTVPWDDAGSHIRFSMTFQAEDINAENAVIQELDRRLAGYTFEF